LYGPRPLIWREHLCRASQDKIISGLGASRLQIPQLEAKIVAFSAILKSGIIPCKAAQEPDVNHLAVCLMCTGVGGIRFEVTFDFERTSLLGLTERNYFCCCRQLQPTTFVSRRQLRAPLSSDVALSAILKSGIKQSYAAHEPNANHVAVCLKGAGVGGIRFEASPQCQLWVPLCIAVRLPDLTLQPSGVECCSCSSDFAWP
jgi:hypothetical protein